MGRYIIRRLLQAIPLLFIISVILFVLSVKMGDPLATFGGRTGHQVGGPQAADAPARTGQAAVCPIRRLARRQRLDDDGRERRRQARRG